MSLIFLVVFVTLVVFLARRVYIAVLGPLRDVPGPFVACFTRLWELDSLRTHDFERKLTKLHQQYGPIVRIGPNKCSVDDPASVKAIYGLGRPFVKSDYYRPFVKIGTTSLVAERDPNNHASMRRKIAQLYSMSSVVNYEGFVNHCTDILETKFKQFSDQARSVELGEYFQFYAFDTGHAFGLMERESDDGIIAQLHDSTVYSNFVGVVPELHFWIQKTFEVLRPLGIQQSQNTFLDFVQFHIQQRRKGITPNDKNDFLTKLLSLEEKGQNSHFDTHVSCRSNIAAGSDTTAITLSAIFYYLLTNPDKMSRLREEIDGEAAAGHLSDPVTFRESQEMPYLQAVIKEGLRIHPAIAVVLARRVPETGATICGKYLPKNTDVGINPWVAHHNEEIFPAANEFRPERWLASKEQVSKMESYFSAFGYGSRTCIGRHISFLEITKIVPQLILKFEFELDPPGAKWEVKTNFFAKQRFHCKIRQR